MLGLFTPKKYIKNYDYVDFDDLRKQGVKLLICDVDNTLVPHDEKHPGKKAEAFVKRVQEEGFQFCLISNNFSDRVDTFAKSLAVRTYPMAKKPLKITYKKICKDYGLAMKEIAGLGDQIMTDVLGGNRAGIYTILTHPLVERDLKSTKWNRKMENVVFRMLEKRGILKKGEYDGKDM